MEPQFRSGAINAGECVSNAWEQIKQNYGLYLGVSLIAMILTGCIPCLNVFLIGPIMGGIFYFALRDMRREPVEFGMMFKGFEKFIPLMVIGLIQSIPGVIAQVVQYGVRFSQLASGRGSGRDFQFFQSAGPNLGLATGMLIVIGILSVVFMVFGIVWWAVFFFAIPLAMEYDMSPVYAIKLSARAAMANIGGMVVLFLLEILIVLVGFVLICVGLFLISMPLIYITHAFVYRQVFPLVERNFNLDPPSPMAYGSNFGSGM